MQEVKMTKEQVIAALKCCIKVPETRSCDNCPLGDIDSLSERRAILMKAALALIEGPEPVTKEKCSCVGCFHNCTNFCDDIKNCRKNEFMEPDSVTDANLAQLKDCPEGESERFPVKTIDVETKFGNISIEYPLTEENDGKIRVFDSNGKYIDYIETESIANKAEEKGVSFEEALLSYIELIKNEENIVDFLNLFCSCWDTVTNLIGWTVFAEHLKVKTREEVLDNEYVNVIGDSLILISEQ